jgi:hypothetical protein
MSRCRWGRILGLMLVAILLLTTIPCSTLADQPARAQVDRQSTTTPRAAFVFGKRGDNLRPLALTIYDTGTVTGFYTPNDRPGAQVRLQVRLSQDVLGGLVKLAQAEGFFALPL